MSSVCCSVGTRNFSFDLHAYWSGTLEEVSVNKWNRFHFVTLHYSRHGHRPHFRLRWRHLMAPSKPTTVHLKHFGAILYIFIRMAQQFSFFAQFGASGITAIRTGFHEDGDAKIKLRIAPLLCAGDLTKRRMQFTFVYHLLYTLIDGNNRKGGNAAVSTPKGAVCTVV